MIFDKPIDSITIDDVRALVRDKELEGQNLDYKQDLPSSGASDAGPFLDIVGAFANASGGDFIFGIPDEMDEQNQNSGRPASAKGIPRTINLDAERLRIVSMIRSNVEPRLIPGWKVVDGDEGPIVILRIYAGWSGPYRVKSGEQSRFYVRTGAGKHAMDMPEIRTAFVRSATLEQRVRQFRDERLARIVAGDLPIELDSVPKLVLHLYPLSAAGMSDGIDVRQIEQDHLDFFDLDSTRGNPLYNIEGYFIPAARRAWGRKERQWGGYTQVFRAGAVEAVNISLLTHENDATLWADRTARALVRRIDAYRASLKALGVEPPIFCMVSIVGARGRELYSEGVRQGLGGGGGKVDRDVAVLPDVVFADDELPTAQVLRPIFDALWQAGNYPECTLYDKDGNWIA